MTEHLPISKIRELDPFQTNRRALNVKEAIAYWWFSTRDPQGIEAEPASWGFFNLVPVTVNQNLYANTWLDSSWLWTFRQ